MTRTVDLPLANYPNGSRATPFRAIPDDCTRVSVEVARCTTADPTIWPNVSTALDLNIDISLDGGQTVAFSAQSGHIVGGIQKGLHGLEAAVTRITLDGLTPGPNRAARLSGNITGGPLRTFGTVEIFTP
jgi:hypothetical protein